MRGLHLLRSRTLVLISVLFSVLIFFMVMGISSVRAVSLPNTGSPAGFTLEEVIRGLYVPTVAKFAPDGRMFVAEKGGAVKIVKDGQILAEPFYVVRNVNNYVDRGLLGLALDPNFSTNGYVYFLYTYDNNPSNIAGPKTAQLLRVTASGDKAVPGSEVVILGKNVGNSVQTSCRDFPKTSDCLPADGLSHAPGSVEFGPDGKMYVTTGDAAGYDDVDPAALNALDIENLAGKVLRINPDGTAPSDNPFYTGRATDNQSKVFAYGIRNAFRLSVRQSDGLIVVGDVGWNTWEEVNVVGRGANLGWPCYEARDQQNGTGAPGIGAYKDLPFCQNMYANPPANLVWPIEYYPHPPSSAVVGGVFYAGTKYPEAYRGLYFYGDYAKNQIYALRIGSDNASVVPGTNRTFASNAGGPVSFFTGPDGDIYYVAINLGGIYRISYSTDNKPPTAFISSDVSYGAAPLRVAFSSSGSFDPDGDTLSYSWDFGDGSPVSNTPSPTHTFTKDGTYNVVLTVTDTFNNADSKSLSISVGQSAPEITISTPADMLVADPDATVSFSGSATDARDGALSASALRWQVVIHHCPLDSCHTHTVTDVSGASGSFTFPHHDGPFYIQLSLTATNSVGLSSTKSVSVYPRGQAITRGMLFDGINDYAYTARSDAFRLQTLTAEAMVKTLATDDWGSEIVSMGNNWSLRVMPNGNLQFSFWSAGSWQNLIAPVNLRDGLWHHVAAVKGPGGVILYVNGSAVAQNENKNPIEYVYGSEFTVARHGDGDDHFSFNGAIDEVRIWSAARTAAQIQQYKSTTLPSGQSGLIAYYDAEGGSGTTVVDKSSSGLHALTMMGGATWTAGAPLSSSSASPPPPPATANPSVATLADTFSGTGINLSKWDVYPGAPRVTQNERLLVSPAASATGYYGVISKQRYLFDENALFVEIAGRTSASTTAETQLILELDPQNNITLGATGTSLHMRHKTAGINSDTFVPFDAAAMRWWRLREAGSSIYFETSPDGLAWTVRRTVAKTFDLSGVKVILQAGTWQQVSSPGTAQFDNLNTTASTTPPPVSSNNAVAFNGTAQGEARISGAGGRNYAFQTFTLETWVNVQATGVYGGEVISNGNNYGIRVLPDGNLRFFVHSGGLVWRDYQTTGLALKDSRWHHLAVTKSGSVVNIYIDGVLRNTFTSVPVISYTLGTDFVIGRHGDGDNNFNLSGKMDNLRVWDVARTSDQISANMHRETPVTTTGLRGSWVFNGDASAMTLDSVAGKRFTLASGATSSTGYSQ